MESKTEAAGSSRSASNEAATAVEASADFSTEVETGRSSGKRERSSFRTEAMLPFLGDEEAALEVETDWTTDVFSGSGTTEALTALGALATVSEVSFRQYPSSFITISPLLINSLSARGKRSPRIMATAAINCARCIGAWTSRRARQINGFKNSTAPVCSSLFEDMSSTPHALNAACTLRSK